MGLLSSKGIQWAARVLDILGRDPEISWAATSLERTAWSRQVLPWWAGTFHTVRQAMNAERWEDSRTQGMTQGSHLSIVNCMRGCEDSKEGENKRHGITQKGKRDQWDGLQSPILFTKTGERLWKTQACWIQMLLPRCLFGCHPFWEPLICIADLSKSQPSWGSCLRWQMTDHFDFAQSTWYNHKRFLSTTKVSMGQLRLMGLQQSLT